MANAIAVVVGLIVGGVMFCVTFFFTCLGIMSLDPQIGEAGEVVVFTVAGITGVASCAFCVWGIRRIAVAMRK